jgi:hypothetical protein
MPRGARLATGSLDPMREVGAKLVYPPANRLVDDDHAALETQFLDIAQAELEAEIPANDVTDDRRREAMAVIERFRLLHRPMLSLSFDNVTKPAVPVRTIEATSLDTIAGSLNAAPVQLAISIHCSKSSPPPRIGKSTAGTKR